MKTNGLCRRSRTVERRANRHRPTVELMEDRLVLSPTLPLPPPGPGDVVVDFHPPQPSISQGPSLHPPNPCIVQALSLHPPEPA
jgi:hypothetical protein